MYSYSRDYFVAACLAAAAFSAGCSAGESGLVLGKPLFQIQGGTAGAGASPGAGQGGQGASPSLAGAAAEAGAAGAATEPGDPPWIEELCTPPLTVELRDQTTRGQLFTDAVPDPSVPVWAAARAACRILFRNESEVKPVAKLSLIVEDSDGIAGTGGTTIYLSTGYLQSVADRGEDLGLEITGIFHFATSLVFQNQGSDSDSAPPSWLVVGIADYVRLASGYIDRASRAPGGAYDGSRSQTTAFFLEYLTTQNPDIIYQLNQRLSPTSPAWTNSVVSTLMGKDIDSLWADYQATL